MRIQNTKLAELDIINQVNKKHSRPGTKPLISRNGKMNIRKEKKIFSIERLKKAILTTLIMSQGIYGNI